MQAPACAGVARARKSAAGSAIAPPAPTCSWTSPRTSGDWGPAAQFERVNVGGARSTVEAVVKLLMRDVVCDTSKAARVLDWRPRCTALEGIARFARAVAGRSDH